MRFFIFLDFIFPRVANWKEIEESVFCGVEDQGTWRTFLRGCILRYVLCYLLRRRISQAMIVHDRGLQWRSVSVGLFALVPDVQYFIV